MNLAISSGLLNVAETRFKVPCCDLESRSNGGTSPERLLNTQCTSFGVIENVGPLRISHTQGIGFRSRETTGEYEIKEAQEKELLDS
jgi:hypothetical protein